MTMNIFQDKLGWWIPSLKYKDNYWNKYTKEDWFFTPDEIDRRVKMWDLFIISELEYYENSLL